MNTEAGEFLLRIKIVDPKQQLLIENILEDLKENFPIRQVNVTVEDKKLA